MMSWLNLNKMSNPTKENSMPASICHNVVKSISIYFFGILSWAQQHHDIIVLLQELGKSPYATLSSADWSGIQDWVLILAGGCRQCRERARGVKIKDFAEPMPQLLGVAWWYNHTETQASVALWPTTCAVLHCAARDPRSIEYCLCIPPQGAETLPRSTIEFKATRWAPFLLAYEPPTQNPPAPKKRTKMYIYCTYQGVTVLSIGLMPHQLNLVLVIVGTYRPLTRCFLQKLQAFRE